MFNLIDLSYPLDERASIAGHPKLEKIVITKHEEHGRSNTGLKVSAHLGTHVDSPYHFITDGEPIDKVSLEKLVGSCIKIDLRRGLTPKQEISVQLIEKALNEIPKDLDSEDKIWMLQSGWIDICGGYHNERFYRDNWILSAEAAEFIVSKRVKALALDFPVDRALPGGPQPGDAPAHRILLSNGIPLIENLINMESINNPEFFLVAAPIKLVGFDGSPARVFAIEGLESGIR